MIGEFAGCGELQSGQRFLDGSAPRLIRHVAPCEAAAGGSPSPTAGKDQKLSQGAGQSPALSRAKRAAFLSLPYYRAIETAHPADEGGRA